MFEGKLTKILSFLALISSIFLMFYIIFFWHIWDSTVILTFILSTIISFLAFHFSKLMLFREIPDSDHLNHEPPEASKVSGIKVTLLFILILSILAFPIIILFIAPRLYLVIALGIVCGASISNLLISKSRCK